MAAFSHNNEFQSERKSKLKNKFSWLLENSLDEKMEFEDFEMDDFDEMDDFMAFDQFHWRDLGTFSIF